MKIFLRLGLVRRLALGCLAAACGSIPCSAQALMPWTGEGPCSALVAAGNVAWQCDFRDYQVAAPKTADYVALAADPAHSAGLTDADALINAAAVCVPPADEPAAAASPAVVESVSDQLPYDWQADAACGPTDWECAYQTVGSGPSVGRALQAIGELVAAPSLAPIAWRQFESLASELNRLRRLDAPEAAAANKGARAGAEVALRTAAGRLSGVLGVVGRQCLGASAALERLSQDAEPSQGGAPTARQSWRPQPSAEPFGHLGL